MLARYLSRPVVDKTGITGDFDFDLKWSPDQALDAPSLFSNICGFAGRSGCGMLLSMKRDPVGRDCSGPRGQAVW